MLTRQWSWARGSDARCRPGTGWPGRFRPRETTPPGSDHLLWNPSWASPLTLLLTSIAWTSGEEISNESYENDQFYNNNNMMPNRKLHNKSTIKKLKAIHFECTHITWLGRGSSGMPSRRPRLWETEERSRSENDPCWSVPRHRARLGNPTGNSSHSTA